MAWDNIGKPSDSFSGISKILSFLLINSSDFLLINSSGDRLIIKNSGDGNFDSIDKPSTSFDK